MKIIIGTNNLGTYNNISYYGKPIRLNSDGSIDAGFNFNGAAIGQMSIKSMALQPDGKIIFIGDFNFFVGSTSYYTPIFRLNSDGSVDTGFQPTFTPSLQSVDNCTVQSDGKIIVGGTFTSTLGTSTNSIARLNNDGTLDATFNFGGSGALFGATQNTLGSTTTYVNTIKLQSDGKIIILGNFGSYNNVARRNIARLNSDGTLDLTFDPGAGFNELGTTTICPMLNALEIQPDGKILVGGDFMGYNGVTSWSVVRINTDGSVDNSFSVGAGFSFTNTIVSQFQDQGKVRAIALQSDGKMIIGGFFEKYNGISQNNIVRLNANGSLDTTFNLGIGLYDINSQIIDYISNSGVHVLNVLNDDSILISGKFYRYDNTIARNIVKLDSQGNFDLSFNSVTAFDDTVKCSAIQPDGKILVGGSFTKYNNTNKRGLVRLNTDGSIDTTFGIGSGIYSTKRTWIQNLTVNSIVVQPDSKIILAGYFESFNGVAKNSIARLNGDGSVDMGFTLAAAIESQLNNDPITKIALQSDGKILLVIDSYNKMYRLNSNGSLDTSFTPVSQANGVFALLPDGKILYNSYASGNPYYLQRLNSNGTLDTSFNQVTCGTLYAIDIQSDNKIIIAGLFGSVNGYIINHIARLNPDGTLDVTFYPSGLSTPTYSVNAAKVMPNGKILISGNTGSGGTSDPAFLYRLNTNGAVETSFSDLQIGSLLSGNFKTSIYDINLQANGNIYLGGSFTSFGTDGRNRFARLTESALGVDDFGTTNGFKIYPNPTASMLTIDVKADCEINAIQIFNSMGQKVIMLANTLHQKTIDVSNLKSGTYFIKMDTNYGSLNKSFIKE